VKNGSGWRGQCFKVIQIPVLYPIGIMRGTVAGRQSKQAISAASSFDRSKQ
jgi:hypothetical protein